MSGKGDTPRPFSVDAGTFAANYDRIFGNKERAKPEGSPEAKDGKAHEVQEGVC